MDFSESPATIDWDSFSEFTANFSETARTLFAAGAVLPTLASVVELSVATVEGCDFAGIFLIDGDEVTTPAHSDPMVCEIDALQHEAAEGPCLDAVAHGLTFYADDLATDLRWPSFATQAAASGIRSVLALPLTTTGPRGALNLYARYPAAFGVVDRAKAAILVSLASLALSVAHSHEHEERRAEDLHAALITRQIIGEALGILMEREKISSEQAFDILRRASQHLNLKLRQVAQNLVDTGESPDTGLS
jgi:GAF domain-containing protein